MLDLPVVQIKLKLWFQSLFLLVVYYPKKIVFSISCFRASHPVSNEPSRSGEQVQNAATRRNQKPGQFCSNNRFMYRT